MTPPVTANLVDFIPLLFHGGVKFILIGGAAAMIHGLGRATYDVDVVYARDEKNCRKLVDLLQPHQPYLRGVPRGLPFRWDLQTIQAGLNFTLTTTLGDIDLLGEVTGGGKYEDLLPHTAEVEFSGARCRLVKLEKLIYLKRAAGRTKDLEMLAQLEALLEEREANGKAAP